jgi:DNA-binding transcriptional regulator YiaG
LNWWTRTQRIRNFAEVPIEAAILDAGAAPIYQQIAPKAFQLQQLEMSNSAIARRLGVTDKTVAKAVAWFRRAQRPQKWHNIGG